MALQTNTIQLVLNMDGSLIDKTNAFISSINEYYNVIQVVAPMPVTDSVSVNYLIPEYVFGNYTQYLVPLKDNYGNYLYGKDVIDSSKPYYQTAKDWYVWQMYISSKAISAISKYHSGSIGASVTFRSYKTLLPTEAITDKGTFGSYVTTTRGDLPLTAAEGDYFKCYHYSYYSNVADLDFTFGDLAIWNNGAWIKSDQYELRVGSASHKIGVEAAILGQAIEDIEPSITEQVLERLSFLENTLYGHLIGIDFITFNKDYVPTTKLDGMLYYDNSTPKQTLTFINTYENGETQEVNIGQKSYNVGKNIVGYLPVGTVVTYSGAQDNHLTYIRAKALYSTPELNEMIGVMSTNVDINEHGPVVTFGQVDVADMSILMEDDNDSMLTFGTKLYLSVNQAGRYTTTEPERPNASIWVATVLEFNENSHRAIIFVNPIRLRTDGGGVQIVVSETQPTNQVEGDFWYELL